VFEERHLPKGCALADYNLTMDGSTGAWDILESRLILTGHVRPVGIFWHLFTFPLGLGKVALFHTDRILFLLLGRSSIHKHTQIIVKPIKGEFSRQHF